MGNRALYQAFRVTGVEYVCGREVGNTPKAKSIRATGAHMYGQTNAPYQQRAVGRRVSCSFLAAPASQLLLLCTSARAGPADGIHQGSRPRALQTSTEQAAAAQWSDALTEGYHTKRAHKHNTTHTRILAHAQTHTPHTHTKSNATNPHKLKRTASQWGAQPRQQSASRSSPAHGAGGGRGGARGLEAGGRGQGGREGGRGQGPGGHRGVRNDEGRQRVGAGAVPGKPTHCSTAGGIGWGTARCYQSKQERQGTPQKHTKSKPHDFMYQLRRASPKQ